MEVQLDKRYPVAATPEQCWAVLSDIHATAACMPGAQITEQIDETHFKGKVRSKVGPAVMMFGGDIELLGLDPAARSLEMMGKGADKSGSSAQMNLAAHIEPGETAGESVLVGVATIRVSGKLAQFGSRLLVPVSDAMLAQFADNFRAAAAAAPAAGAAESPAPADAAAPADASATAPSAPSATSASGPDAAPGPTTTAAAAGNGPATAPAAATTPAPAAPRPATPARPVAAAPANELNALKLIWIVIKGWFANLFGRKPG